MTHPVRRNHVEVLERTDQAIPILPDVVRNRGFVELATSERRLDTTKAGYTAPTGSSVIVVSPCSTGTAQKKERAVIPLRQEIVDETISSIDDLDSSISSRVWIQNSILLLSSSCARYIRFLLDAQINSGSSSSMFPDNRIIICNYNYDINYNCIRN